MRRLAGFALVFVLSSTGFPACERAAVAGPGDEGRDRPALLTDVSRPAIAAPMRHDETRVVSQVRCDRRHPSRPACVDHWKATALRAGWPASSWPWLRCVMYRESKGDPRARGDGGESLGLMQIHVPSWERWLRQRGYIRHRSDLYNPAINLRAARAILRIRGDKAWENTRRGCP